MKEKLLNEVSRKKDQDASNKSKQAMNATKGSGKNKNKKFQGECFNCKKPGHKRDQCWAKCGGDEGNYRCKHYLEGEKQELWMFRSYDRRHFKAG